jgi:hypothetical protein
MNNWCICRLFTHIFTARRLYKSFGVKGLSTGESLLQSSDSRTQIVNHTVLPTYTAPVLNTLRKTTSSFKPSLGCDKGLCIQARLRSVWGSHELIRHMGCDNVNPIQLVIFVATAGMAGVSWMSTVYGNSQHFTTVAFLRNKIKPRVSIFSHYIYTLYLISKSRTVKRESPSSRTCAFSTFKYFLFYQYFVMSAIRQIQQ